jgi:hypothetical protein
MTRSEFLRRLSVLFVPLAFAACGESEEDRRLARRNVELGDIPAAAVEAAKKAMPDVKISETWKNVDREGNLRSYELRGSGTGGKIREVRVSPTGEVLEME